MDKRFLRLAVLFLGATLWLLPAFSAGRAEAAGFHLTSETLLRFFERGGETVAPAYEYLRADAGALGEHGLSFHFHGWGRADLAGADYYPEDTAGEVLTGFLEYTQEERDLRVRLGRQEIFEGLGHEAIDGLRLGADLGLVTASAYGGFPVSLDSEQGRSGDRTWGARIARRGGSLYEVGVSWKQTLNDSSRQEEMLGADLYVALPAGASLAGQSSYNLRTDGWGEHAYELRFGLGPVRVRPFFERYQYDDYFGTGDQTGGPFRFLAGTDETLTVYGAELSWPKTAVWEFGLRGKGYDYDRRGDSSQFYSGLATWHGAGLTQAGGELGLMQGDAASNDYWLGRLFFYRDLAAGLGSGGFLSGDALYVLYDEDIFGEDTALFLSLGGGARFFDNALELRLSGDYSQDPFFDDDLRGLLVAKYVYDL